MATRIRAAALGSDAGDPDTPKNSTFSLRLRPNEFEILNSLAKLHKKSLAELAREFIRAGIRDALDPAEIDRRIEEEKNRLMAAADEMRKAVLDETPDPAERRADDTHKV
ncbi:hypothetical protein MABM_52930 (plasmid) [Mycobacteroides abscessus]|uniref:DUF6290 family protein n=1 Tax=Mycobacteroides abscessus TaxID=36809 RepID=UPI0003A6A3D8|nr:DUF6290 family protein [Mycobacteroides abscessus]BBZ85377.1 hypothetical protein MABM_52930 [Mycobacteroides abscessus]